MAHSNLTAAGNFHAFIERHAPRRALVVIHEVKGNDLGPVVKRFRTADRSAKTRARTVCRQLARAARRKSKKAG